MTRHATDLEDFLAEYDPDGARTVATVDASRDAQGNSPLIVVRHGNHAVIINPLAFDDHLCIDVHSFVAGQSASAGVFGMTRGQRFMLQPTGETSHGWPAARLIAVLVGVQA